MNNNDNTRQRRFPVMSSDGATNSPQSKTSHQQQWLLLAEQLTPLVGEAGFSALYARTIRLVRPGFPWLSTSQSGAPVAQLLEILMGDYQRVEPDEAERAHAGLLETFTRLLSSLIGEALTIRLLDSAVTPGQEQKNAQEQKQ
ncbi:MAG TPA: hypothetical protein VF861_14215 [Telluria sp.]